MKEKFALTAEKDILDAFDEWCTTTRTPKGEAAQLGLWIVSNLNNDQRGALLKAMDTREMPDMILADPTKSVAEMLSQVRLGLQKLEATFPDIAGELDTALAETGKKRKAKGA